MADYSGFLKGCDGITGEDLDNHGERRGLLMLSHWQMLWNSLRSGIVLPLKTSMTIETKEF